MIPVPLDLNPVSVAKESGRIFLWIFVLGVKVGVKVVVKVGRSESDGGLGV